MPFPNLGWNSLATEIARAKDSKDAHDELESPIEENDLTERMNTEQLHAFLDAKLNFDECSLTRHLNEGSNVSRYELNSEKSEEEIDISKECTDGGETVRFPLYRCGILQDQNHQEDLKSTFRYFDFKQGQAGSGVGFDDGLRRLTEEMESREEVKRELFTETSFAEDYATTHRPKGRGEECGQTNRLLEEILGKVSFLTKKKESKAEKAGIKKLSRNISMRESLVGDFIFTHNPF